MLDRGQPGHQSDSLTPLQVQTDVQPLINRDKFKVLVSSPATRWPTTVVSGLQDPATGSEFMSEMIPHVLTWVTGDLIHQEDVFSPQRHVPGQVVTSTVKNVSAYSTVVLKAVMGKWTPHIQVTFI